MTDYKGKLGKKLSKKDTYTVLRELTRIRFDSENKNDIANKLGISENTLEFIKVCVVRGLSSGIGIDDEEIIKCKTCPHVVGDFHERDCAFPDCIGGWEVAFNNLSRSIVRGMDQC